MLCLTQERAAALICLYDGEFSRGNMFQTEKNIWKLLHSGTDCATTVLIKKKDVEKLFPHLPYFFGSEIQFISEKEFFI